MKKWRKELHGSDSGSEQYARGPEKRRGNVAAPAEVVEQFSQASSRRNDRFTQMAHVVAAKLETLLDDPNDLERQWWDPYVTEIVDASSLSFERDFDVIEALIRRGYQRVLLQQDIEKRGPSPIPATAEEWDLLPDALSELERRRKSS